jgi:Fe-S oxidoreductase/nitrate reductase gamma subunit
MPNRPDFWGIEPEWIHYLIYVILTAALLIMVVRIVKRARIWTRIGQPEKRSDQVLKRLWKLITQALFQARILSQPYAGIMHVLIAWSMLLLFLGTPIGVLNAYIFPGFLKGTVFLVFKLIMDLSAVAFLVGAGMAAYRRMVIKPEKLTLESKFGVTLILLTIIILSGPVIEGSRLAVLAIEENITYGWWMPFGWLIAQLFLGSTISVDVINTWHTVFYYFHLGMVAFVFLTLPVGTLLHVITTPLNVFFSKLEPMGRLAGLKEDAEHNLIFADRLQNLSWKQLMDGDACTECGRCQDACPAHAVGLDLNPKQVILALRDSLKRDGAGILRGEEPGKKLIGDTITPAVLWACTTCGACVNKCPAFIDHISDVVAMRRSLVNDGEIDDLLQTSLANLGRYGNSFGKSARMRSEWTKSLSFEIKDATKEPVEYLWFVGDYASFSPSLTALTIKTAEAFQALGLDFGILYDSERNAGNDVRRVGEEGLFEVLVEQNSKALQKTQFKTIITTDPHTYNTLKNEYPAAVMQGRRVMHYSELLDQLIHSGQLKLSKKLDLKVTYHDPCYLSRYNEVYDPPRRVIQATGCEIIEMPRNRENGFCCGAGGGRIYLDEEVKAERPSENRIREAAALNEVTQFIVTCPKDYTMFQDAVKTTSLEEKLKVLDLIDLVTEAL